MAQYSIGRLKGRFVIVYRDRAGKRHRFRLEAKSADEAHRIAPGLYAELTQPQSPTVEDVWQAFIADRAGRPIIETMRHTWKSLQKRFQGMKSTAITVADCRAHMTERREVGISDNTIITELGHLRMVLRWAEKRFLIARAPYIERPPKPPRKEKYLTKVQAVSLIASAKMPHIRLYIILALGTGARTSALLDLTWDRVDFDRGLIDLRNPLLTRPHKGRAIVPMTNTVRAALIGAKQYALCEYVVDWGGKHVQSVKRGLKEAARLAKIGSIYPHLLRHSAAVHMAEDGVPMEEIAQFLGHNNINVTRLVYARFSPDYLRRAAAALEYGDAINLVHSKK